MSLLFIDEFRSLRWSHLLIPPWKFPYPISRPHWNLLRRTTTQVESREIWVYVAGRGTRDAEDAPWLIPAKREKKTPSTNTNSTFLLLSPKTMIPSPFPIIILPALFTSLQTLVVQGAVNFVRVWIRRESHCLVSHASPYYTSSPPHFLYYLLLSLSIPNSKIQQTL